MGEPLSSFRKSLVLRRKKSTFRKLKVNFSSLQIFFPPFFIQIEHPLTYPHIFLSNFGTTLLRWMCWQIQHAEEAKIYCGQNSFEFPSSKYYTVRDASSSTKKVYFKYRSRAYKSCKKSLKYVAVLRQSFLHTKQQKGEPLVGFFFFS